VLINRPKLSFAENERALCFHGPLMYEAKVRPYFASLSPGGHVRRREPADERTGAWNKVTEADFWDKDHPSGEPGPHYKVHYKGWKQT
jgi:mortality factor 4-like protein 1